MRHQRSCLIGIPSVEYIHCLAFAAPRYAFCDVADREGGNDKGRVIARRGSFDGIDPHGAPRGLLFPASLALWHGSLFVTNLALPLTEALGDEPEEDVTTYTVSRIPRPRH